MPQQKYQTLRLRFAWDKELVQIIDNQGSFDWKYQDISSYTAEEKESSLQKIIQEDLNFNLQEGSLFRGICG